MESICDICFLHFHVYECMLLLTRAMGFHPSVIPSALLPHRAEHRLFTFCFTDAYLFILCIVLLVHIDISEENICT